MATNPPPCHFCQILSPVTSEVLFEWYLQCRTESFFGHTGTCTGTGTLTKVLQSAPTELIKLNGTTELIKLNGIEFNSKCITVEEAKNKPTAFSEANAPRPTSPVFGNHLTDENQSKFPIC